MCTSMTFVDQDHIGCKILEINYTDNYANTFALRSTKAIYLLPGEYGGKSEENIGESLGKWCAGAQKRQYL